MSVASSLLGGVLTDLGGWRWVFYVDLPLAAVCLVLAILMPETRGHDHPVDWVGALLIGGSLFCVVLALVRADDDGWASGVVVGLLVGGAALALALTAWELRTRAPLLDLRLFANPACAGVSLVAFLSAMCMFGTLLYIAIYLQQGLGYGPLATGLRFLPVVVPATVLSPVTGRALRSLSPHVPLALGAALIGAGFLLMARVAPASGWESIVPGLVVAGVGLGLLNPSLSTASIAVAPRWRSGMASGTNNTFRQVGVTTGIALFGTLLVGRVGDRLSGSLAGSLGEGAAGRLARALVADGVDSAVAGAPAAGRRALAVAGRVALGELGRRRLPVRGSGGAARRPCRRRPRPPGGPGRARGARAGRPRRPRARPCAPGDRFDRPLTGRRWARDQPSARTAGAPGRRASSFVAVASTASVTAAAKTAVSARVLTYWPAMPRMTIGTDRPM